MPMLAFFPWLRISEPFEIDLIQVFPVGAGGGLPEDVASEVPADVLTKIVGQYRLARHLPQTAPVPVVRIAGKTLGEEFSESERTRLFEFARHLAVCGLSDRRFLGGSDEYTAAGHYQLIIQAFPLPFLGNVNSTYRRKGGSYHVMDGSDDVHFVLPAHLVHMGHPRLNLPFLAALQALYAADPKAGERVAAATVQFNLSNSDSPEVPVEVETIASYAAFERLVDKSDIKAVREEILELLTVFEADQRAGQTLPKARTASSREHTNFSLWITQLYKLRGVLAHGQPASKFNSAWSTAEHAMAAAFVFPLVLKALLAQLEIYKLTDEDVAHALGVDALLAGRPFIPARIADEDEESFRARSLWLNSFKSINRTLFDRSLTYDLERAVHEVKARETVSSSPTTHNTDD